MAFYEGTVLLQCYQCISVIFSGKVYCEACCGGTKKWDTMFLCRSLLLSTTVLNDIHDGDLKISQLIK